jgi:glycerol-3-phosphate dehydrogenase
VIVITGGKLTTYRSMAAQVVDTIEKDLNRIPVAPETDRRVLPEV